MRCIIYVSTHCIKLQENNQDALLRDMETVMRFRWGVPFKQLDKLIRKLLHAAIGISYGNQLFVTLHFLLYNNHKQVYWDWHPDE